MRTKKQTLPPGKLAVYKCDSCGELNKHRGECTYCEYEELTRVTISRKRYCTLFGHFGDCRKDKEDKPVWDYDQKCKRCGVVYDDEVRYRVIRM